MEIKRGNTYNLKVIIRFNGTILKDVDINKIIFIFGDLRKETPEVTFEQDHFIINFTQEDTLKLKGSTKYETIIKLKDNSVVRSDIKNIFALDTLLEEAI